MVTKPPPVPASLREKDPALFRFLQDFIGLFNSSGNIDGSLVNIAHTQLTDVLPVADSADTTADRHFSDAQYAALLTDIASVGATANAANSATSTNAAAVTALTTRVDAAEVAIATLQGQVTTLQGQVTALQTTVADHETRLIAGGL